MFRPVLFTWRHRCSRSVKRNPLLRFFLDKLVLVTCKARCKVPFWSQARGMVRSCCFATLKCLSFTSVDLSSSSISCLCCPWLDQKGCGPWMWPQQSCDLSLCFIAAVPSTLVHTSLCLSNFSPWHLGLRNPYLTPWHRGARAVAQPLCMSAPVLCLQMVLGGGQLFQSQQDLLHRTSPLLLSYYLIRWASQCLASDIPIDTL